MSVFRYIGILLFIFASCNQYTEQNTIVLSEEYVLNAIQKGKLNSFSHDELSLKNDTIYSLLSVKPQTISEPFYFLARRKIDFYVFQQGELIYKNLKNEFYQGSSSSTNSYFHFKDDKKQLHKITLRNNSPLSILVKHHSKREMDELISFEKLYESDRGILLKSNLPLIEINTLKRPLDDNNYQNIQLHLNTDSVQLSLMSKLKIRGASSKSFPKKQFSLKANQPLLFEGIQLKKAVLYAPYIDRSLLRNKLTYDLYAQISKRTTPSQFCNVLINDNFEGIYMLIEHPKQQYKSIRSSDSSSFLVQIDRCPCDMIHNSYEDGYIKPGYSIELPAKCNNSDKDKINQQLLDFENDLYLGDFSNIAMQSFIDFIIINELSKNIDAYRLSTFLAFDGEKMNIGPIWDFNIAWGLAEHASGYEHEGFVIDGVNKKAAAYWWQALWENESFQEALKLRYSSLRATALNKEEIDSLIDSIVDDLGDNIQYNNEKWDLFGKNVWPNKFKSDSYQEEVDRLKLWIDSRLSWLDSQWLH
jgi:hypothetical protein